MGMRRQILLKHEEGTIYLYTHWGADGLETVLSEALKRSVDRWSDPAYLSRIIFTDMTKDASSDKTGYGLALHDMGPDYENLIVDIAKQTVNDVPYEDFIKNPQMFAIQ